MARTTERNRTLAYGTSGYRLGPASCSLGSNCTVKRHAAFQFVAEPKQDEADEQEPDRDGPAIERHATPAAWRFMRIEEPIRIPMDDRSAHQRVDQIGDRINYPEPDVLRSELR